MGEVDRLAEWGIRVDEGAGGRTVCGNKYVSGYDYWYTQKDTEMYIFTDENDRDFVGSKGYPKLVDKGLCSW